MEEYEQQFTPRWLGVAGDDHIPRFGPLSMPPPFNFISVIIRGMHFRLDIFSAYIIVSKRQMCTSNYFLRSYFLFLVVPLAC